MNKDERAAQGPEIRAARERLGLTQVELASAADVNPRTLRNIETGQTVGQPDVINRITIALNHFEHGRRRSGVAGLDAIQERFSQSATAYYEDAESLNTALLALVQMQTNLLRGDLEAARDNAADFFLPTFFILSDLAARAGSPSLQWVPALKDLPDEEVSRMAVKRAERDARARAEDSIEGHEPPMDAAAHTTGRESEKQRMMREQDEAAERQD